MASEQFVAGDRVVIQFSSTAVFDRMLGMNGLTGTLVKPRRMLNLRRVWVVKLDQPFRGGGDKTTVAVTALRRWPH